VVLRMIAQCIPFNYCHTLHERSAPIVDSRHYPP
jgi:hypothetical protein